MRELISGGGGRISAIKKKKKRKWTDNKWQKPEIKTFSSHLFACKRINCRKNLSQARIHPSLHCFMHGNWFKTQDLRKLKSNTFPGRSWYSREDCTFGDHFMKSVTINPAISDNSVETLHSDILFSSVLESSIFPPPSPISKTAQTTAPSQHWIGDPGASQN